MLKYISVYTYRLLRTVFECIFVSVIGPNLYKHFD